MIKSFLLGLCGLVIMFGVLLAVNWSSNLTYCKMENPADAICQSR